MVKFGFEESPFNSYTDFAAARRGAPAVRRGEDVSTYLGYTLAFLIIGLFAGYASEDEMPVRSRGNAFNYAAAVAGALAGGLLWLALRHYGWGAIEGGTQAGQGPEALAYAHHHGDTTQPGYWIGLFFAAAGSMLALALYRLVFGSEEEVLEPGHSH